MKEVNLISVIELQREKYFKMNIHEVNFQAEYLFRLFEIDYDVYLPSIKKNLQRELVWTVEQKRELILSILYKRQIPRFAMIELNNETMQIIDGKQRLTAIKEFLNGGFGLSFGGVEYLYEQLPLKYKRVISHWHLPCYIYYEEFGEVMPDEDKIFWFKMINFSGTPQTIDHLNNLR